MDSGAEIFDVTAVTSHLRKIRQASRDNPEQGYAEAMTYLNAFLELPLERNDRKNVYMAMALEQGTYFQTDDQEKTTVMLTEDFPESPLTWIHASCFYCWGKPDAARAKAFALRGVEVARADGHFIMHAMNTLCRAANLDKDYALLEQTIVAILQHQHVRGMMDCNYEEDFLMKLPDGVVDATLVARLREACKKVPRRL